MVAGLLQALEQEATAVGNATTHALPTRHHSAVLLLCFKGWQCLGARWGRPYTEVAIHEG